MEIYQLSNNFLTTKLLGGSKVIKQKIYDHLVNLSPSDRYMRFFNGLSDDAILNYATNKISFKNDGIIVVIDNDKVIGFVHIARIDKSDDFECGISIDQEYRQQNIGFKIFQKSISWAKANSCKNLYLNCLYQNIPMNKMVKKFNLDIKRDYEDGTNTAKLEMSGIPDLESIIKTKSEDTILVWDLAYRKQLNKLFNFYK